MKAMVEENTLLTGSIFRHILRLSWPMVIAFLFQTSYNFVDRFFVSRLGDLGTAAIGMSFLVQLVIIALGSGLGVGVNSFISRNLGARKTQTARETALHTFFLALAVGLGLAMIGLFLQRPLFILLGANGTLLEMVLDYLTIIFLFTPVILLMMLSNNIFRGWGDTVRPMKFMLSGTFLNIILDPILIFGWGPIPTLGIKGAALATGIARSMALIYILLEIFLKKRPTHLSFSKFKFQWRIIRGIFQVGLPSSASQILTSIAMSLIFIILKPFGAGAKAAYTIVFTYEQVTFLPAIGIAQAVTILTGHNFGARNLTRVKQTYFSGILVALGMLATSALIIFFNSSTFAGIFARSLEVLNISSVALKITAVGTIFISFYLISIASFQGLGLGRQYLWANLGRLYLLQIPMAYLGAYLFNLNGVWFGLLAGNILSALALLIWYRFIFKKKIQTGEIQPL